MPVLRIPDPRDARVREISLGRFSSVDEFIAHERRNRFVAAQYAQRQQRYAAWQLGAATALRRCRNLDRITHPLFGTVSRTRTSELAPYVLPGEEHLFENPQPQRIGFANYRDGVLAAFFTNQDHWRWGDRGELDFHTAERRGKVKSAERRAVSLLFDICDHERARQYLQTGLLACMGNITGKTYIVRRKNRVMEIIDGVHRFNWCIHSTDHSAPPTDEVIALKNLIEGEEVYFRKTANRSEAPREASNRPRLIHENSL